MPDSFHCTVVTPQRQLLEQAARYASVPAWDGQVGIAPRRAPLLVRLGFGVLRLDMADGTSSRFFLGGGFAQMKDNQLDLLCDEAVPEAEIDREQARADLASARAEAARTEEEVDRRNDRIARARAMLGLAGGR